MAINIDKNKCTGCGECVEICPVEALKIENNKVTVNDECIDCGACESQCPSDALSL